MLGHLKGDGLKRHALPEFSLRPAAHAAALRGDKPLPLYSSAADIAPGAEVVGFVQVRATTLE